MPAPDSPVAWPPSLGQRHLTLYESVDEGWVCGPKPVQRGAHATLDALLGLSRMTQSPMEITNWLSLPSISIINLWFLATAFQRLKALSIFVRMLSYFHVDPPRTAWDSPFKPPVHMTHVRIAPQNPRRDRRPPADPCWASLSPTFRRLLLHLARPSSPLTWPAQTWLQEPKTRKIKMSLTLC